MINILFYFILLFGASFLLYRPYSKGGRGILCDMFIHEIRFTIFYFYLIIPSKIFFMIFFLKSHQFNILR